MVTHRNTFSSWQFLPSHLHPRYLLLQTPDRRFYRNEEDGVVEVEGNQFALLRLSGKANKGVRIGSYTFLRAG